MSLPKRLLDPRRDVIPTDDMKYVLCIYTHPSLSHTHLLSLHTHTFSLSLTHTCSLSRTLSHVLTHTHTHTHTHIHTLSFSLTHTQSLVYIHVHTLSFPLFLLHTHTHISPFREDGLPIYAPEMLLRPVMYINYNQTVTGLRSIHVATTGLESTCLVLAFGLGMCVCVRASVGGSVGVGV